jgi:DNA polymerase-1
VNSPIQGTASELCVASIARLVDMVDAGQVDAEVVLPVHDSIMLVAPEKTWRDAALAAREAMMSYPWVTRVVPLEVDVEVGTKWGSLEKAKL